MMVSKWLSSAFELGLLRAGARTAMLLVVVKREQAHQTDPPYRELGKEQDHLYDTIAYSSDPVYYQSPCQDAFSTGHTVRISAFRILRYG